MRVPTFPFGRRNPRKVGWSSYSRDRFRPRVLAELVVAVERLHPQLCSCTHSPAAIGFEAKPMICPNFRIGASDANWSHGHLVPSGDTLPRRRLRLRAVAPGGNSSTAMTTLSDALSRRARGVVMASFPASAPIPLGREHFGSLASNRLQEVAGYAEVTLHRLARRVPGRRARLRRRSLHARKAPGEFGQAATSAGAAPVRGELASCPGLRSLWPCRAGRSRSDGKRHRPHKTSPGHPLPRRASTSFKFADKRVLVRRGSFAAPPRPRSPLPARCG